MSSVKVGRNLPDCVSRLGSQESGKTGTHNHLSPHHPSPFHPIALLPIATRPLADSPIRLSFN